VPASPALTAAWNQAETLYTAGDRTAARDVLEHAAEVAIAAFGPDDADVIETQRRLALAHRELDDPAAARRTLEQALAAGLLRYGEADPLMLSIFAELGTVAEQLGNRHEARRNFMRVIQYGPESLGYDHPDVRAAHAYLGGESAGPVYIPPPRPDPQEQPGYAVEPTPAWSEPAPSWVEPAPSWTDTAPSWADAAATEVAAEPAPSVDVEQIPVPPVPAEHVQPVPVESPVAQAPVQLHAVPPPHWQGGPPEAAGPHPEWTTADLQPPAEQPPALVPGDEPGVWRFEPATQPSYPQAQPSATARREPPQRPGERRRLAIPLLVLAGVALLALAAASVVTVLAFLSPPASDNPSGGTFSAAPSVPTLIAPSGVKLRDNGASITLTWKDPSHATLPFIVAGGRAGEQSRPYLQVPAGQTTVTLNGLSTTVDYCFTVVAVYTTDQLAPSDLVCTRRDMRPSPSAAG
jgi:hypothetical protein